VCFQPVCEYEVHENSPGNVTQVRRACRQWNACEARVWHANTDSNTRGSIDPDVNIITTTCMPSLELDKCENDTCADGTPKVPSCLTCQNAVSDEECEEIGEWKECSMSGSMSGGVSTCCIIYLNSFHIVKCKIVN
jgi:hypothetical protein